MNLVDYVFRNVIRISSPIAQKKIIGKNFEGTKRDKLFEGMDRIKI